MTQYALILVESFIPDDSSGHHGVVHIRPLPNQEPYESNMFVACSKRMSEDYPVGTRFEIRAKITQRENGQFYIYSHHKWPYKII